jgi:L-amino acid N-acyltransferase YncA
MAFEVVPIAETHIEGFHAALDSVARERHYLYFLEAPALEDASKFVRNTIGKHYPHFVALEDGKVIGWCDVLPVDLRPVRRHTGMLGIGVLARERGRGIGSALLRATLNGARALVSRGSSLRIAWITLGLDGCTSGSDSSARECSAMPCASTERMRMSFAWHC